MGFLAPKPPKLKPPAPTILTPQPFDPTPAQAVRPTMATAGSGDSRIGTLVGGTQNYLEGLKRRPDEKRRRSLIGG